VKRDCNSNFPSPLVFPAGVTLAANTQQQGVSTRSGDRRAATICCDKCLALPGQLPRSRAQLLGWGVTLCPLLCPRGSSWHPAAALLFLPPAVISPWSPCLWGSSCCHCLPWFYPKAFVLGDAAACCCPPTQSHSCPRATTPGEASPRTPPHSHSVPSVGWGWGTSLALLPHTFCYVATHFQNRPRHCASPSQPQYILYIIYILLYSVFFIYYINTPLNWAGLCLYDIPVYLRSVATADTGRNLEWLTKLQDHSFKSNKTSFDGLCLSLGPRAQPLAGGLPERFSASQLPSAQSRLPSTVRVGRCVARQAVA